MNALTFSFQSLVHCAADISDTTEFSKSEPSQRKILEKSVEDWQEELIPRVLGFESKYSYKDSNLAHFWGGDTDSEENWLARPRNEDMSQMHRFGGTSDVILDDLGMFWRYLGMQNHSVLNLTKYPKSHLSTQFVCVSSDDTRLEPNLDRILRIISLESCYHVATRCVEWVPVILLQWVCSEKVGDAGSLVGRDGYMSSWRS